MNFNKNKSFQFEELSYLTNPFSYLPISNLNPFLNLKRSSKISQKDTKTFIKLALKDFNESVDSSIYISEAVQILSK